MRNLFADQSAVRRFGSFLFRSRLKRRAAFHPLHRHHPAIAASSESFDVLRFVGGITQRLPQPIHSGADAVLELDNRVVRPKLLLNLFALDHLAGMLQEEYKDAEGLLRQTNRSATERAQFSRAPVKLKALGPGTTRWQCRTRPGQ